MLHLGLVFALITPLLTGCWVTYDKALVHRDDLTAMPVGLWEPHLETFREGNPHSNLAISNDRKVFEFRKNASGKVCEIAMLPIGPIPGAPGKGELYLSASLDSECTPARKDMQADPFGKLPPRHQSHLFLLDQSGATLFLYFYKDPPWTNHREKIERIAAKHGLLLSVGTGFGPQVTSGETLAGIRGFLIDQVQAGLLTPKMLTR